MYPNVQRCRENYGTILYAQVCNNAIHRVVTHCNLHTCRLQVCSIVVCHNLYQVWALNSSNRMYVTTRNKLCTTCNKSWIFRCVCKDLLLRGLYRLDVPTLKTSASIQYCTQRTMSLRTLAKLSSIVLIVSAIGLVTLLVDQNPFGAGKSQFPRNYTTGEQQCLSSVCCS